MGDEARFRQVPLQPSLGLVGLSVGFVFIDNTVPKRESRSPTSLPGGETEAQRGEWLSCRLHPQLHLDTPPRLESESFVPAEPSPRLGQGPREPVGGPARDGHAEGVVPPVHQGHGRLSHQPCAQAAAADLEPLSPCPASSPGGAQTGVGRGPGMRDGSQDEDRSSSSEGSQDARQCVRPPAGPTCTCTHTLSVHT